MLDYKVEDFIGIGNNRQEINETNYFDHFLAKKGYAFVSLNAGAFRLLLPDNLIHNLKDMKTAEYVIVSRGKCPQYDRDDMFEIMFEDHTDRPFIMFIDKTSFDMVPNHEWRNYEFPFTVWTRRGKELTLRGKYRKVNKIPWMKPW